jgi:hypothetical protein
VSTTPADDRSTSRLALHEAELLLNEFRHNARTALRTHIASGRSFTTAQLAEVRTELDRAAKAVRDLL